MSDTQEGPDWWLGTDGKWYPPVAPADVAQGDTASADPLKDQPEGVSPPKQTKPWWRENLAGLIAVGGTLLVLGVVALVASLVSDDERRPSTSIAGPRPTFALPRVTYKVEGTARSVDITIETAGGGTSQQSGVDVPLTNKSGGTGLSFDASPGQFLYISAQNNDSYGTVTCVIEVDGEVIAQETSSGGYVIATCSGSA